MAADGNQNPDEIRARAFKTTTAEIVKYPKADERKPLLTLYHARDATIDRSCSEYLLKGIIDRGTLGAIYGPQGVGKTFTALALGRAIAAGVPFLGMKTRKSPVLYLGLEAGARNIEKRIKIASEGYHADDPFFWSRVSGTDFDNPEFFRALVEKVKEAGVKFIIIDTLKKLIGQRDENGPGMAYAEEVAERLIYATGAAVCFVAHTRKGTDYKDGGIRGGSSIMGTLDWAIFADKDESGHSLTLEKVKDGEDKIRFSYRLERVDCGADDEGDPITTCRAVDFERAKGVTAKPPPAPVRNIRKLQDALVDASLAGLETTVSINGGPPRKGFTRHCLVPFLIRSGFFSEGDLTEHADKIVSDESFRPATFERGKHPLTKGGQGRYWKLMEEAQGAGIIENDLKSLAVNPPAGKDAAR